MPAVMSTSALLTESGRVMGDIRMCLRANLRPITPSDQDFGQEYRNKRGCARDLALAPVPSLEPVRDLDNATGRSGD